MKIQNSNSAALVGRALFLSGIVFSLGSVEMSSRFSIQNFAKDQTILQSAADALSNFIVIALIWTVASTLVLYAEWGMLGLWWGLATNMVFSGWIIITYLLTFKRVAKRQGLEFPHLFHFSADE
jgi:Na+-driven multidrug efflux pump